MSGIETGHEYQTEFYDYINAGSLASARVVCPLLVSWLRPNSVLDVGCGAGAWCRVWSENGVGHVVGVDGDYVDTNSLLIPPSQFLGRDLREPFQLNEKFDLVVSLEVAEHIEANRSRVFIENLTKHSDVVLFSAAVPGQGGEFHVNEQPLDYWKRLFQEAGFSCFDALRPVILADSRVEPWYRYNSLLYVRDSATERLPESIRGSRVEGSPAELAPLGWRTRNAILGSLPSGALDLLVKAKHAWGRKFRPAPRS